jgi:hypothetical protein
MTARRGRWPRSCRTSSTYQDWIDYDLALIPRFDACLRLTATCERLGYSQSESSGADGEVREFQRLGKPVFYSVVELYRWIDAGAKG